MDRQSMKSAGSVSQTQSVEGRASGSDISRFIAITLLTILISSLFISRWNFLVLHVAIETFCIFVCLGIFVVAWFSRHFTGHGRLYLVGLAGLSVAVIDSLHMLSYKGMGLLPVNEANVATQFWMLGRLVDAGALLLVMTRPARAWPPVLTPAVMALVTLAGIASILVWPIFPTCYVEGQGLTPVKIGLEYLVMAALGLALAVLWRGRADSASEVWTWIFAACVCKLLSELCFTVYVDVHGITNSIGHAFKLAATLYLFRAVIERGLKQPQTMAAHALLREREIAQQTEIQLRAERDRAQSYFEAAGVMLVVIGRDLRIQAINSTGAAILRRSVDHLVGREWADLVVPEDRVQMVKNLEGGLRRMPYTPSRYRATVKGPDGPRRLIAWRSTALRDSAGTVTAMLLSGEDVTEQSAADQGERELVRERDRRILDAMALMQAITRLGVADGPDNPPLVDMQGRVEALAGAMGLLARAGWTGLSLEPLLIFILSGCGDALAAGRVRLAGPPVALASDAVQHLALALHELADNAHRHGACGGVGGSVGISWSVRNGGVLELYWQENLPEPAAGRPTASFGLRLVELAVAGRPGGQARFDWQPQGLRATLILPGAVRPAAGPVGLDDPVALPAVTAPDALDGCRLLLVGQDALLLAELHAILEPLGCHIIGTSNGMAPQADLLSPDRLDMVLADMDGLGERSSWLADLLAEGRVPVVLIGSQGHDTGAAWQSAIAVPKPYAARDIIGALAAARPDISAQQVA